jgi:hypothetical protein
MLSHSSAILCTKQSSTWTSTERRNSLSNYPRALWALHLQHKQIGDEMLHFHGVAVICSLDSCSSCLLALRHSAVRCQRRAVVVHVVGEGLVQERPVLAVDGVRESVAALRQTFNGRGEIAAFRSCDSAWEGREEEGEGGGEMHGGWGCMEECLGR